jgi:hypothetical protein
VGDPRRNQDHGREGEGEKERLKKRTKSHILKIKNSKRMPTFNEGLT